MKRFAYIPLLMLFLAPAAAQTTDSLSASLTILNDSIPQTDTLSADTLTIDSLLFDETMATLDTALCLSAPPILELPDSVYKARLQSLPYVIELPYNQAVRTFILRYLKGTKRLSALQRKAEYYFPLFTDALGKNGLPYELCYLPVIESALNPTAHSRMGAAGLWQFMPSTGRNYGLEINSLVDERMDPVRSTEAACQYMKTLYSLFNDWTLAIAAYNCGPGNVNKAIARAGKRDFWAIYPFLPRETRSYVPIFIAAAYVMNFADLHGLCPATMETSIVTDTIQTDRRQHLQQISVVLGISMDELRRLNPQYAHDILPGGKNYALCLPSEKVTEYILLQDSILGYRSDELINNRRAEIDLMHKTGLNGGYSVNGVTYYKIKSGDTLGGIAKKFHCTVKQLQYWNGLKNTNIRAGKTLKICK